MERVLFFFPPPYCASLSSPIIPSEGIQNIRKKVSFRWGTCVGPSLLNDIVVHSLTNSFLDRSGAGKQRWCVAVA